MTENRLTRIGALTAQPMRYALVGGAVFVADYLLFLMLYWLSPIGALAANIGGKLGGAALGFAGHKYWTFAGEQRHGAGVQLASYVALLAFNLVLSTALLWLLTARGGMQVPLARLLTDAFVIAVAFGVSRTLIFAGARS